MASDKVIIKTYYDFSSAQLAKTLLDSESIECFMMNENMKGLYNNVLKIQLQVTSINKERAMELLNTD